jgi:hypothetical protein
MLDHCGLLWHRQVERFVTESTTNARTDYYSVFKDPLVSAWQWQKDMGPDDVRSVLRIVEQSAVGKMYLEDRSLTQAPGAA